MSDSVVVITWECPHCGRSGTGMLTSPKGKTETALKAHAKRTDDNFHGPQGKYPDGFTSQSYTEFVSSSVLDKKYTDSHEDA